MAFTIDKEVLKTGLIIFRRGDVEHRNFYCRIKLPKRGPLQDDFASYLGPGVRPRQKMFGAHSIRTRTSGFG
jgi:hypothetical protein